ncbi:hypothetical protein TGAM01_v204372, partial [Trichoderma gamsii]
RGRVLKLGIPVPVWSKISVCVTKTQHAVLRLGDNALARGRSMPLLPLSLQRDNGSTQPGAEVCARWDTDGRRTHWFKHVYKEEGRRRGPRERRCSTIQVWWRKRLAWGV